VRAKEQNVSREKKKRHDKTNETQLKGKYEPTNRA
jgi:hypothetical protein